MGPPARPARRNQFGRQWRPAYRWALAGAIAAIVLAVILATAFLHAAGDTAREQPDLSQPVVTLLWQARTGHPAAGGPTITGTGLFIGGTDGMIRGFAKADGLEIWKVRAASNESAYVRASAAGVVYATTGGGTIIAIDARNGEQKWRKTTETAFSAPPAIGKYRIFAAGRDSQVYSYRTSGRSVRIERTGEAALTDPIVIKDAAIVASTDERLYVLPSGSYVQRRPQIGRPAGSPVAVGDAACTPLTDGSVRCVRISDGDVLPRIALPGTTLSAPASDGRRLFAAGTNGTVGAWDPQTGKRQWLTPDYSAGACHLARHQDRVVVTCPDGRLFGLDAATGRQLWAVTLPDHFDTAARADDMATYVVGRTGTVYALQTPGPAASATPSARTPATTTSPSRTRSHPGEPPEPVTSESSPEATTPPVRTPPTPTVQPTDAGAPVGRRPVAANR